MSLIFAVDQWVRLKRLKQDDNFDELDEMDVDVEFAKDAENVDNFAIAVVELGWNFLHVQRNIRIMSQGFHEI